MKSSLKKGQGRDLFTAEVSVWHDEEQGHMLQLEIDPRYMYCFPISRTIAENLLRSVAVHKASYRR